MAKRKSSQKSDPQISLRNIIYVAVILAAIAAIIAFYLSKEGNNQKQDKTPPASQVPLKEQKPAVLSSTPEETKTMLEGNWVSDENGTMLEIHGNKFSMDSPSVDNHTFYEGALSVSGNTVTFTFKGKNTSCPNQVGVYTFQFKEKQLIFKIKEDSCTTRSAKLPGNWVRL